MAGKHRRRMGREEKQGRSNEPATKMEKTATTQRKLPRPKSEAVLIKGNGKSKVSYAEMLKAVKQKASSVDVASKIGKMRETRDVNLLIELEKGSKLEDVSEALRTAVGDQLSVRPLVPTVIVELRDLEDVITREETKEALTGALGDVIPDQVEVKTLRAGPRGTRIAVVILLRALATAKVLKTGKVRVGWVNARAREKKLVLRCYKCLEYEHTAAECKKTFQGKRCYRCGEPGHLAATCDRPYRCPACESSEPHDHRTGDASCTTLRTARGKLERRSANG